MSQGRRNLKSVTLKARLEETPEEYLLHLYTPRVAGMPDGTYFTLTAPKHGKKVDKARDERVAVLHCQELVRSYIFHKTLPGLAARYMSAREIDGDLGYWPSFCLTNMALDPPSTNLDRADLYDDFLEWCQEEDISVP